MTARKFKGQPESVRDFKLRIARIMRGQRGDDDNIIPLRHAPPLLVRKPTDRGYYPPSREERQ
jgi:hypothetical protein